MYKWNDVVHIKPPLIPDSILFPYQVFLACGVRGQSNCVQMAIDAAVRLAPQVGKDTHTPLSVEQVLTNLSHWGIEPKPPA